MSETVHKVVVDADGLRNMAQRAKEAGTQDAWIDIALTWIDAANGEIGKLHGQKGIPQELIDVIAAGVNEHGAETVLWSWEAIFKQLLPFAATLRAEQEFISLAKAHGLSQDQARDAVALMGNLLHSDEMHPAFLAGEALLRNAKSIDNLRAAIAPAPTKGVN